MTPLGEDLQKLEPIAFGLCPMCFFSLLILLCFNLINHSNELDYMLSPVSPLSKSPNLGMLLETLTQVSSP